MQFRHDAPNGPGLDFRRSEPCPRFPVPPLLGGFSVDYGPRLDDRRHTIQITSRQQHQQHLSIPKSSQRVDDREEAHPSRHLWVGNVSLEVTEGLLIETFSKFGPIESVTVYSHRNYAFVNFRNVGNARVAKNGLQGALLGGLAMRIEYANGEISVRLGTAMLHEEWGGTPRDDRDYSDKLRGPIHIQRVPLDPLRHSERDLSCDKFHGSAGGLQVGSRLGTSALSLGRGREKEEPSDVLWVGFPLLSEVDDESLQRAFAPHGEVERVKTFPGRTYAFVQFKNIEDASRAKAALEGKLFDDPRVHIQFSNSEIGPVHNLKTDGNIVSPSRGREGPGNAEKVIGRVSTIDKFCSIISPLHPTGLRPEYYPGGLSRGVLLARAVAPGSAISSRHCVRRGIGPCSPDGRVDERDYKGGNQDGRGIARSVGRLGGRPYDRLWDLQGERIVSRETKRLRTSHGGLSDSMHNIFHGSRSRYPETDKFLSGTVLGPETHVLSSSQDTGGGDEYSQGMIDLVSGQLREPWGIDIGQGKTCSETSPLPDFAGCLTGEVKKHFLAERDVTGINEGWRWHGAIAKGGTPVCRTQCLPVGKGIAMIVPDVVNCTARTDLEMLAKHVSQASDFGVVFFTPEADVDVCPYHDFMHYLGEKRRAGVAKLADGTTLFLVPPSEFSDKVLKVPGNNCLFGVVLKSQRPSSVGQQLQQQLPTPQSRQGHLSQKISKLAHQQQDAHRQQSPRSQGPAFVNGRLTQDTLPFLVSSPQGQASAPATTIIPAQLHLASLAGGLPAVLTPELIASLTSLLPQQNQAPIPPVPHLMSVSNLFPPPAREGMGPGGVFGRLVPNMVPRIPLPVTVDSRSIFRPPQYSRHSTLGSQGWSSTDQQSNAGGHMLILREKGPVSAQYSQGPHCSRVGHSPPGEGQQGNQGARSQGFSESVCGSGQPVLQQPTPLEHSPPPQLPPDELEQLTALLTQRHQQPTHEQQAAQLQQHYQQQLSALNMVSLKQQLPASLQSHLSQTQVFNQRPQPQPQQHAVQSSSQQRWSLGGFLPQHPSQSVGHPHIVIGVSGGVCDGPAVHQVQQQQQQLPQTSGLPPPFPVTIAQQLQQSIPAGAVSGELGGVASQDDVERQKRFQATLQLAAALLQQMQHQQLPGHFISD